MFHTQTNSVRQMQNKILLLKCLPLKLQDRTTLPLKSMNADHILNRGNCQSSTDVYETSCLESNQILCLCSVHRTPRESHQGYHHTRNTTVVQSRAKVRVPIFWDSGSCVRDNFHQDEILLVQLFGRLCSWYSCSSRWTTVNSRVYSGLETSCPIAS